MNNAILKPIIIALCAIAVAAQGADIFPVDLTTAVIQAAIDSAVDGDRVILPVGSGHATTPLSISGKSITILGATTVDSSAGTANDQTIIYDDFTGASWGTAVAVSADSGKIVRISGITFLAGIGGPGYNDGVIDIGSAQAANTGVRIDHCHFKLNRRSIYVGTCYGVIDHNWFNFDGSSSYTQSIIVQMGSWNGDTNGVGDLSWSDYPWFGTEKAIFIEDNYFKNTSSNSIMGCIDGDIGMHRVMRYNHFYDVQIQTHGTENRVRGARATEVYNNDFHFVNPAGLGGIRTGAHLIHDNTIDGISIVSINWFSMSNLRLINRFNVYGTLPSGFSGASGRNAWDINVTEADGITHVDGNADRLFLSGTAQAGTTFGGITSRIVAAGSPGWTTNQWVGFTVERLSDNLITSVQSNDANSLTMYYAVAGGSLAVPDWQPGDQYEVRRTLITIDQPGRGKCDPITGGWNQGGETINSVTGTIAWPHQAQEPIYNYNNIYSPGDVHMGVGAAFGDPSGMIYQAGRDYFNDADGASSAAVIAKYNAALNGVDYTGPFTYPHPLVVGGGGGPPPPAPGTRRISRSNAGAARMMLR